MADQGGQGLERLTPLPGPRSTRWWLWVSLDEGFQFARGGRCASAMIARTLIAGAYRELVREYEESRGKWAYLLGPDGGLVTVYGEQAPRGVPRQMFGTFEALPAPVELGPADPPAAEDDGPRET